MAVTEGFFICKGKFITKILKTALLILVLITMVINISFILKTSRRLLKIKANEDTQPKLPPESVLEVKVHSSKDKVSVSVNGAVIYVDAEKEKNRGIHVLVLNQATGNIMAKRSFDTYEATEDAALIHFLSMISDGRIIILAIKEEGTFNLKTPCKTMLQSLGSDRSFDLNWRDMWAMITVKGGNKLDEAQTKSSDLDHWGGDVDLTTKITLKNMQDTQPKLTPESVLEVKVHSSKDKVSVSVNGAVIYVDAEKEKNRGIHVLVLNQATGNIMAKRSFDTYEATEDAALIHFLSMISDGRIIILAIKEEGTFNLKTPCKTMLQSLGSDRSFDLNWRDMWAMITVKGGNKLDEAQSKSPDLDHWGDDVDLTTRITLKNMQESQCAWRSSPETIRRQYFCSKYEGYGSVCSCKDPAPLTFSPQSIDGNRVHNIPVSVMASNRPHYLFRMLQSLLSAQGVNIGLITVFVDGYFEEPVDVASLFGVKGIHHTPMGIRNGRIAQHYKTSIAATFNLFPKAEYAIILEEELDVSPDFFSYFSQTIPLLEEDNSLYCISAWNDQGYNHSCKDPSLLYRIETMPGLGWLLKKSLFLQELEAKWPTAEKNFDWDVWMRTSPIRKDRECIIPDVSRTYHFGTSVGTFVQDAYFRRHSVNTLPHVKLKDVQSLTKDGYEVLVNSLIQNAKVLDHAIDPCDVNLVPKSSEDSYVLYIKMETPHDYTTWSLLATCWHLWDFDARGFHKLMWRFFLNGSPVIVIGTPFSPYSKYKPEKVIPVLMKKPTEKKKN